MTATDIAAVTGTIGGVTSLVVAFRSVFTARQERRRMSAEAEELETNARLKPLKDLIDAQGQLIDDLEQRVGSLRQQLVDERDAHAKKIDAMQDDIATLQRRIQALIAS